MTMAGPSVLAARSALACATVDLCGVYLDMIQRCSDAEERGEAMDVNRRAAAIHKHHGESAEVFIAAWQHGSGYTENLRVAEVAVRGFVRRFDVDEQTKAAGERVLLGFIRDRAAELQRLHADVVLSDPRLEGLAERLGALLNACKAEGYHPSAPAVSAAIESLGETLRDVLRRGFDLEYMQVVLDCWSAATGGPGINVTTTTEQVN